MTAKYLLWIVIAVLLLILIYSCIPKKKNSNKDQIRLKLQRPVEDTISGTRIIRLDVVAERAWNFVEDFMNLYKDSDFKVKAPTIREKDGNSLLTFSDDTDFMIFCWWVNYLTYSEKGHRHNATGWYGTNTVTNIGDGLGLNNTTMMFFVPESDDEHDNVYFVNKDGTCFKQEFAWPEHLFVLKDRIREYEECPR